MKNPSIREVKALVSKVHKATGRYTSIDINVTNNGIKYWASTVGDNLECIGRTYNTWKELKDNFEGDQNAI